MFLADMVEQASNDDGNYLEMESEEEEVQQNWLLEEDADANDEEVVEKSQTEKRIQSARIMKVQKKLQKIKSEQAIPPDIALKKRLLKSQ